MTLAATGAEAVKYCLTQSYDVVLMDFNMPHLNGIELTKLLLKIDGQQAHLSTGESGIAAQGFK